ncbi:chromate transporter [Rhizosaccharibacter radicis]|uniref:Chromate transporter n=1 Tax=Rhizosaccharibacter radicis TaxID=2782605 RepID=A0ABT1VYD3_9PROT|nr:chromate transporter [Acetobacteraceae bacterium KSS12]
MTVLLSLLLLFGSLSLLAFGGGNAVMVAIQHAAVDQHHWMTTEQFVDLFALSRAAPGPGSLIVALVGQKAAGIAGALVACLAMYLPSSLLVTLAARFWRRHEKAAWRFRVEQALVPLAIGLTVGSGVVLALRNDRDPSSWIITIIAAAILTRSKLSPLLVLGVGGLAGLLAG